MTVKQLTKKFENFNFIILKLVFLILLFVAFFAIFAISNPQIIKPSRTAAVTMSTFAILGMSMLSVYGGVSIGKKKSKDIISSIGIAVVITDFVTYFQLCIMNTNQHNQNSFTFSQFSMLLLVILVQILIIFLFTYLGNYLYFRLHKPENCIVICDNLERAPELIQKTSKYKKQYHVTNVLLYTDETIYKHIKLCDSIFLYNVPALNKSEIVEYAYQYFTNIYIAPELSDVILSNSKHIIVDDMSMICTLAKELTFEQRIIKRLMDIVISGLSLLLFSPIMLIEAIAIKLYDGGPVLFRQERATIRGRIFNVLKFRTMIVDADSRPASEHDDRITKVGRILRKLRIDELPQLINILNGDMSVVGPRPERIEHVEKYTKDLPEFKYRLRAKAGLTGLAQISGKYNTTPKDKLILDLMYIQRFSIWLDIVLIFQTLKVFFKSDSTEGF